MKGVRKPDSWYRQSGVIAVRVKDKAPQVLLVTSNGGKRWVIPKGIVEKGYSPGEFRRQGGLGGGWCHRVHLAPDDRPLPLREVERGLHGARLPPGRGTRSTATGPRRTCAAGSGSRPRRRRLASAIRCSRSSSSTRSRSGGGREAPDRRPARESRKVRTARRGFRPPARAAGRGGRRRDGPAARPAHDAPGRDRHQPGGAHARDRQTHRPRTGLPLGRDPHRQSRPTSPRSGPCSNWCAGWTPARSRRCWSGTTPGSRNWRRRWCRDFEQDLPTGAVVEIDLPVDTWAGVRRGGGSLRSYDYPKNNP